MSTPGCGNEQDHLYLAHLNTPNIARDLNLVRHLAGYTELDYWGCGYGAVLGITYAAMFPQNVGRMVLDGITLGNIF
jgi:pimeloyl-ACP methyl ester carboxylesterase